MSAGTTPGAARRRRIRAALAERDGAQCWYCGHGFGPAPALDGATIDHLIPRRWLPTWTLAALVLACEPCNTAKADRLPQALLRPAAGRFGPGLAVEEGANACRAFRVPRVPCARVREAEPSGQGVAAG
ncbi:MULTISPECIES: HNH endonuclease [unclassified Streptomyces]|uniref:HNH endonuclease n=1 Tax=unclassified Streptomyces TaxID=2593676 RepID=UPI00380962BB